MRQWKPNNFSRAKGLPSFMVLIALCSEKSIIARSWRSENHLGICSKMTTFLSENSFEIRAFSHDTSWLEATWLATNQRPPSLRKLTQSPLSHEEVLARRKLLTQEVRTYGLQCRWTSRKHTQCQNESRSCKNELCRGVWLSKAHPAP